MIFDTHTHLDQEEFDGCRDEVIRQAVEAGVTRMVAVGTTLEASRKCVALAEQYPEVVAAVGIQPNYIAEAKTEDWDQIVQLAAAPSVVAIGETGLDRYWDYTPLELQRDYFYRHIELSQTTGRPFIVHMRDCAADILEVLREAARRGPLQGVMHSFTGDVALAEQCLELGMYVSFAGMVTFKKSDELRQAAAAIPDDRLLLETDAPYLSPEPVRSKRPNQPAYLRHTAERVAEVRGASLESLAQITTANALRFFGLSES